MERIYSRLIAAVAVFVTLMFVQSSVFAASSGVLMKFTDKTRFYKIGTSEILSDLVVEKMLASGKIHLKETRPIDTSAERKLYEKNAAEVDNAVAAMQTDNLDVLFEGEGFNANKAGNIDTAVTGQTVQPELTRAIGEKHDAQYLIQGTIENMGLGMTSDGTIGNVAAKVGGSSGGGLLGGVLRGMGGTRTDKKFLGVAVSLRIIEAQTGRVVWDKNVVGQSHVTNLQNKNASVGNTQLMSETFHKAMDDAAKLIVDTMMADSNAVNLFR